MTINQVADALANAHAVLSQIEAPAYAHAAIAFCQCEVARNYRATKADPRYLHRLTQGALEAKQISTETREALYNAATDGDCREAEDITKIEHAAVAAGTGTREEVREYARIYGSKIARYHFSPVGVAHDEALDIRAQREGWSIARVNQ